MYYCIRWFVINEHLHTYQHIMRANWRYHNMIYSYLLGGGLYPWDVKSWFASPSGVIDGEIGSVLVSMLLDPMKCLDILSCFTNMYCLSPGMAYYHTIHISLGSSPLSFFFILVFSHCVMRSTGWLVLIRIMFRDWQNVLGF